MKQKRTHRNTGRPQGENFSKKDLSPIVAGNELRFMFRKWQCEGKTKNPFGERKLKKHHATRCDGNEMRHNFLSTGGGGGGGGNGNGDFLLYSSVWIQMSRERPFSPNGRKEKVRWKYAFFTQQPSIRTLSLSAINPYLYLATWGS